MARIGFKPPTPVLEWAKTLHVLDRAATVIGEYVFMCIKYISIPIRHISDVFLIYFHALVIKF
jgi:hypothetical protein